MGVVNDKNNKKQDQGLLEENLFELEGYVKSFWEFLPIPACYVNLAFNILDVGREFEKFSGFKTIDIIGQGLGVVFKYPEEIKLMEKELQKGNLVSAKEVVFLTKNKAEIPVVLSATSRRDNEGSIIGYFFAFLDITSSKTLEAELREKVKELQAYSSDLENTRAALLNILQDVEEEKKKAEQETSCTLSLIQNFADGLFILDGGVIKLINPKAKEIFQVDEREVVGKKVIELINYPTVAPLAKIIKEKGLTLLKEEVVLSENFILEVSTVSVCRGSEEGSHMIIVRDITREKVVERMKTEFVSVAAHQLRTPLSAIKWIIRMMLDGDLGSIPDVQKDFLEKTYQSNEKMIRLINDLLNTTRIEEGRFLYELEEEDIVKFANKILAPFRELALARGLKFVFQEPGQKPPVVKIDGEKFAIVLENLVENAINYSKQGTITVSLIYLEKEQKILFKIEDQGIGIALSQQRRVFTRFFRASNALKTETEGTGLGLFIARNIVEAHGGEIWFKSEEDKGTTFYFTLPVKR